MLLIYLEGKLDVIDGYDGFTHELIELVDPFGLPTGEHRVLLDQQ